MKDWIMLSMWQLGVAMALSGQATVTSKDLKSLVGSWEGSLTYLDYSSGKPYTMPANLDVLRTKDRNLFQCDHAFPEESEANWTDTLAIQDQGKSMDGELVQSKQRQTDGSLVIVTTAEGTDGNDHRPAVFRHTYTLGKTAFSIRKEVKFVGEADYILRNEYQYHRIAAGSNSKSATSK